MITQCCQNLLRLGGVALFAAAMLQAAPPVIYSTVVTYSLNQLAITGTGLQTYRPCPGRFLRQVELDSVVL